MNVDPTSASAQVDFGAGPQSASRFLLYQSLAAIIAFCWTASLAILKKMFMSWAQSIMVGIWQSIVAQPKREQEHTRLMADEAPRDGQPSPAQTTSPKKVSWSYLRGLYMVSTFRRAIVTNKTCVGVSLALSELCQDGNYGGDRIPISAILDLSTNHSSSTAPGELKSYSEAASKRVRSAGASCGEGRSQAAHPARTSSDSLIGLL
jgi:hypothetical protein